MTDAGTPLQMPRRSARGHARGCELSGHGASASAAAIYADARSQTGPNCDQTLRQCAKRSGGGCVEAMPACPQLTAGSTNKVCAGAVQSQRVAISMR